MTATATVEAEQLTKYYGEHRGVEDLDLEVVAGEVHGFLGPNGAGKSTTIRVLLDFHRPTRGSVRVFGLDSRQDSVAIRRRVGFLSSDLRLFERMTGSEHLAFFTKARGSYDDTLAAALIGRFDIAMERPIAELSKGNRQKVGLLLAFVHRPELLILDEPTTGLDPLVQSEFDHLVRETAAEGSTVLLSSHSLAEVQRVADRVTIIRDGRLVITDSVDHLRESAPRVMSLRFDRVADPEPFRALESVQNVRGQGDTLTLQLTGAVAPVLQEALRQGVVDLSARHADLDELFLSYYSGGEGGPVIAAITTLDLSFRRKSLIGYSVGMAVYVLVVVALYPSFKDSTDLDSFTESSPGVAALFGIAGSLTSPVGWLSANVYANFFPLILLVLTIGYGAFCLAGQERDGQLELVLSLPLARGRVVVGKLVALATQTVAFCVVVFLASLAGRAFELTVDVGPLASTTFGVALLGLDFGLLAMAVGAATGKRGEALGIASAVAGASYLISSMAPLVEWLEPARYLSLFYWTVGNGQLEDGLSIGSVLVLVAVGVVVALVALRAFDRHDLT